MKRLTPKDRLFCLEYLKDPKLNAERAAIKAGYSISVAKSKAYQWVSNSKENPKPHVKAFVDEMLKKKENKLDVSIERIMQEYISMGFSNIVDIIEAMGGHINIHLLKNLSSAQKASISEIYETENDGVVSRRIKMHPKMDPLKQLERMLSGISPQTDIVVQILRNGEVIETAHISGDNATNTDKI